MKDDKHSINNSTKTETGLTLKLTAIETKSSNYVDTTIKIEESLFKTMVKANLALNSTKDAIVFTNFTGNIEYMNLSAESISGCKFVDTNGIHVNDVFKLLDYNTRQIISNPINLDYQLYKSNAVPRETILIRRDGNEIILEESSSPIFDNNGAFSGVIIVLRDISKSKAQYLKLAHLAYHDTLTKLPNRLLLDDRIKQAFASADRLGTQVALLFIDIDNFKRINDSLGHAMGDKILQSVASCLVSCVRSTDTVSRQGGDEFIVLLTESKIKKDVFLFAKKILEQIATLHKKIENAPYITSSMGISIYPSDAKDADTLIEKADIAMYQAKKRGKNNFQFYLSNMVNIKIEPS